MGNVEVKSGKVCCYHAQVTGIGPPAIQLGIVQTRQRRSIAYHTRFENANYCEEAV